MSEEWSTLKAVLRMLFPGAELEGDGFKVELNENDPRKGTLSFDVRREDPDTNAKVGFDNLAISRMSRIFGRDWTFEATAIVSDSHRGPFLAVRIVNVIILRP